MCQYFMPVFSVPMLTEFLFGWYIRIFITVFILGVDSGAFWSQMQNNVDLRHDILNGAIKSAFFSIYKFDCNI